jgi:hypothetical protein
VRHGRGADDEPDGGDEQPGDGAPDRGEDGHPCLSPRIPKDPEGRESKESATTKCEVRMSLAETTSRGAGPASSLGDRLEARRPASGRGGAR